MTHEEKLDSVEELMAEIVKALVDHPEAVEVEAVEEDEEYDAQEGVLLELRVAPDDLGKVIGKQGRTVRSMRTILNAVGSKHHQHYTLDVIEDDDDAEDEDDADEVAGSATHGAEASAGRGPHTSDE
jgi:predicted RNA-binding protein YlqC (UPF0109 family)